jgi:hypothetical protein
LVSFLIEKPLCLSMGCSFDNDIVLGDMKHDRTEYLIFYELDFMLNVEKRINFKLGIDEPNSKELFLK